jgi:hypothetical protein
LIVFSKANFTTSIPVKSMKRGQEMLHPSSWWKANVEVRGDMKDSWAIVSLGKEDFWLIALGVHEKRELAYSVPLVMNIKRTVKELVGTSVKFEPGLMVW